MCAQAYASISANAVEIATLESQPKYTFAIELASTGMRLDSYKTMPAVLNEIIKNLVPTIKLIAHEFVYRQGSELRMKSALKLEADLKNWIEKYNTAIGLNMNLLFTVEEASQKESAVPEVDSSSRLFKK